MRVINLDAAATMYALDRTVYFNGSDIAVASPEAWAEYWGALSALPIKPMPEVYHPPSEHSRRWAHGPVPGCLVWGTQRILFRDVEALDVKTFDPEAEWAKSMRDVCSDNGGQFHTEYPEPGSTDAS